MAERGQGLKAQSCSTDRKSGEVRIGQTLLQPISVKSDSLPPLTLVRRRVLRTLAHALTPIVRVGEGGLSENVMHEVDQGLRSHELIKIRVLSDEREIRGGLLEEICRRLDAYPVQHIGKILIVYRPKSDQVGAPSISKFRRKKESRRTKRSFQT
ncbi:putative RNA-binding protein, YhbY family [Nitrosospira sp. Nl5]|uniref:ribosome assembly RNA-binding protein YhbY n=1 Tax=Nitrosospira sp. Nl5 TaxID=200120 RepID=UPI0008861FDF|nr:ribosome assembly RNA-binding protein YhbY [Nitrosospira sp. Nl5]SCY35821.1 putative RNA-binding protein, YhbY family [Nitrosospira sp. Nl5]